MIQPDEIRRKAERLYPKFLRAWLAGEEFFPRTVPCDRQLDANLAVAGASVQQLQAGSKEVVGFGYSIDWEERNSPRYGRNRFPRRIYFESADDLLRLIGKQRQFQRFGGAVKQVRDRFPVLDRWMQANRQRLIDESNDLDGLLEVVEYLSQHPRPGLFARELPLSVDTKFIERKAGILREWLDLVLPPDGIAAGEEHFARRYGLRSAEPHVCVRFLDATVQQAAGSPWSECSLPLHALAAAEMPARTVLIVENKVNLLTLPQLQDALALGGMGNGVTELRHIPWLSNKQIWYWGDIDTDGFAILSRLRAAFPHVRSLFMDETTLAQWQTRLAVAGNGRAISEPPLLTETEAAVFLRCATNNLRIEQERIPQNYVVEHLAGILAK